MARVLTAQNLHDVLFLPGELVVLDHHAVAFGVVHPQAAQIADDGVHSAGGRGRVSGKVAGVYAGQARERVNGEISGSVRGQEFHLGQPVHNHHNAARVLVQVRHGGGDGQQSGSHGHLRHADGGAGVGGARAGDVVDALVSQQLGHPVGELVVDVAQELLALHRHHLVREGNPLLDVLRNELHQTEGQRFLGGRGGAFRMHVGGIRRQLERHLDVALKVGLGHTAQDIVPLPGGLDHFLQEHGHGDGAVGGRVHGQQLPALRVIAALDVLGVGVDIRLALAHFFQAGLFGFSLVHGNHVAQAISDQFPLFSVGLRGPAHLFLVFLQFPDFLLQSVQVRAFLLHFSLDLVPALHDFFNGLVLHGFIPPS